MQIATSLDHTCRHCGTHFNSSRSGDEFCCAGCATVFDLLKNEGLGHFYDLRAQEPPACPVPAKVSTESYTYCDDPAVLDRLSPDGARMKFYVEGLDCTACLWLLEKLPSICSDAADARVNMSDSTVEVTRTSGGSFAAIARTLNRLGHRPHALKIGDDASAHQLRERRRELIRIGIAGAATGNIMIMAVSLYAGAGSDVATKFRWVAAALAAPVLTYCAWPFYKSAFSALRHARLNIDVPIVAALLAGIVMSLWGLASGAERLYFDSLSMLTLLLLSSRFLLASLQRSYLDSSHLEDELLLSTVTRLCADGAEERISSLSLLPGDFVLMKEKASVPADGRVSSGLGLISTAVMTGESNAIEVGVGSEVEAGSMHLAGEWILQVTKAPGESRLAKILAETATLSKQKTHVDVLANRVAQWFVGVVMVGAIATALWFATTNPVEGLSRALALTIVTCPCVFGMAIPLSMTLAMRAAARRGIVIKNGDAIERLWNATTLFFDKTGTLTRGEMTVTTATGDGEALQIAAALEEGQPHPVAKAIRSLIGPRSSKLMAHEVQPLKSGGIEGVVDGIAYKLESLDSTSSRSLEAGYALTKGQMQVALFTIGDSLRSEAAEALEQLRSRGLQTRLISGDRPGVVQQCARELGFSTHEMLACATPERKSQIVKAAGAGSVMIGDGANDSAALAAADVGIAVRGSMEASLRAADVFLVRPDLNVLPELFEIARKTKFAIGRNLAFSVSFNVIAGALAVHGSMTPLLAAVLMPLSSLTVLLSSLATGRSLARAREVNP